MRREQCLAMTLAAGLGLIAGQPLHAGQFKRLNASALAPGAQIAALASPQNQGNAMEMDDYEFLSNTVQASYRCRILANSTGQVLRLRLIGVDGSIVTSCNTPVNGTCDLPFQSLAPNLLFACTVATANGAPVATGSSYTFAVQRQFVFLPLGTEHELSQDGAAGASRSGVVRQD